jgi:hypothetical protein
MASEMNKLLKLMGLVGAGLLLSGAAFNPGAFPGRYCNSDGALASDVIVGPTATASRGGATTPHGPVLLTGCEFYNANASARSLILYDSATVPADGTRAFKVFIAMCPSGVQCVWGMNGPNTSLGGSGVVFTNGISWESSSTFPASTVGSADATVCCSYQQ